MILPGRLAYGGDYNPEQWPRETWNEDVALMREAGVNLVTVGVFAWARLQPEPGIWDFDWLDEVLDLLHSAGIAVDLATATASPPPWFSTRHPAATLIDADGVRRRHGARQAYCPSSPEFRAAAVELGTTLARRYGRHPAVVLWHVGNEFACHNWHCYCDTSAAAFRAWLAQRYETLEALNDAWGTSFWSQHYGTWDEIVPPGAVAYNSFANPTQQLDWWRFCSAEHVALFRAEADALHEHVTAPVTTNFMSFFKPLDYWAFAEHVDVISNDDYLIADDPNPAQRTAMAADLMRSLARGRPWLLMEHSPSAVNWQPRNVAKAPGELRRNSLQHLARGADGALFFQWRASRAGAEKFHSALLPHAGTDSRGWREAVSFGAEVARLAPVAGSRADRALVAVVHDWSAWWAAELDAHPSVDVSPMTVLRRWYGALWDRGVAVDFVPAGGPFDGYRLVVVPGQYLVTDADAAALDEYVRAGGATVVTYFSGIVDEHDHIRLGGYPGAYRDLLGVRVEEFAPLLRDASVGLSDGSRATVWSEHARAETATVLATYVDGPTSGSAALTVHDRGAGRAWYVGTELADASFATLFDDLLTERAIPVSGLPPGVEVIRRSAGDTAWVFAINHTDVDVEIAVAGHDLLRDTAITGTLRLAAGDATVMQCR